MSTANCSCPNCGQHIEFDLDASGTDASCPNCGKEFTLYEGVTKRKMATVDFPPAVTPPGRTVKEYLKKLRENSCYGALRTLIDVSFLLCAIGCLLAGVGLIVVSARTGSGILTESLFAVPATLLSIVLLIAFRQAAFVAIDIADALIHQGNETFKQQ